MNRLKEFLNRYLSVIFTCVILIVFAVTRLWRLTTIPSGLHLDETSMAYSAWCLSQYGVDRYLNSWPVYLLNFGGGQSLLYAYLLAGLFKLFGFHLILIRLPSVIFSLLTLVFGMAVVKMIVPEHKFAPYIVGAIITICPYFIMAGRLGLDCNLMLGCSTVFLYCFLKAVGSGTKRWYAAAGFSGGILLYSYAMSYLMLPLFLVLALIYTILVRKFSLVKWVIMAIPMGILAFPLILEQVVNMFGLEPIKLGIFTVTRMDSYRASELERFSMESLKVALKDIFVGDTWLHNSIPGFQNLYWISIPLAVVGIFGIVRNLVLSIRRHEMTKTAFVFFWFAAVLFVVCHIYPCINQVNSIFFAYAVLATEGVLLVVKQKKPFGEMFSVCIAAVFAFSFLQFGKYYYLGQYTIDNYPMPYFDVLVTDALDFIEEHPQYGPKGVQMAETPVYLGLSTLRSPYELQLFDKELYILDYYYCSHLGEIEDGYYYIVRSSFADFSNELRAAGFTEITYTGYSLFYQE